MATKRRPVGISILAILQAIGGFLLLGLGAIAMSVSSGVLPFFRDLTVAVSIVVGLFSFIIAYGLWNGSGWAWTLSLIFAMFNGLWSVTSLPQSFFNMLINGLIFVYLTRPHIKEFFGKEGFFDS